MTTAGRRRSFFLRGGRAAAALALVALACGGGGLFGPPEPTPPVPQAWRQPVDTYRITTPALADGVLVYMGPSPDSTQDLFARDLATGDLLWTADLDLYSDSLDPISIDSGLVFVSQQHQLPDDRVFDHEYSSVVLALDLKTGAQGWSVPQNAPSLDFGNRTLPTAAAGSVYFPSTDAAGQERLSAVAAANGDPLWDYPMLVSYTLSIRPVVVGDRLLTAQTDFSFDNEATQLLALDAATGELRWALALEGRLLQSTFATGAGRIYFMAADGQVMALDAATGEQVWAVPLPLENAYGERNNPVYDAGQVFFSVDDNQGTVYALDAATGAENWIYADGQSLAADLAAGSGQVFVGTVHGRILALDAATGAVKWLALNNSQHAVLGSGQDSVRQMDTAPLVHDGVVYCLLQEALVALQVGPESR